MQPRYVVLSNIHSTNLYVPGKDSVGYSEEEEVYAVLEDDGTEVDEEEYFQLLPSRTRLIVLSTREIWSPMDSMEGWVVEYIINTV